MSAAVLMALAVAGSVPTTQLKRDTVQAFASCVRRLAPGRVRELLATDPGSPQEQRVMRTIAGGNYSCIGKRRILSVPVGMFRGQVAEMAMREDPTLLEAVAHLPAQAPVKPDVAAINAQTAGAPAGRRDEWFLGSFRPTYARCVTDANPRAVQALLTTETGSEPERAATIAIGDTLMACMPIGLSYRIIPAELRPYLVAALHHSAARARTKG